MQSRLTLVGRRSSTGIRRIYPKRASRPRRGNLCVDVSTRRPSCGRHTPCSCDILGSPMCSSRRPASWSRAGAGVGTGTGTGARSRLRHRRPRETTRVAHPTLQTMRSLDGCARPSTGERRASSARRTSPLFTPRPSTPAPSRLRDLEPASVSGRSNVEVPRSVDVVLKQRVAEGGEEAKRLVRGSSVPRRSEAALRPIMITMYMAQQDDRLQTATGLLFFSPSILHISPPSNVASSGTRTSRCNTSGVLSSSAKRSLSGFSRPVLFVLHSVFSYPGSAHSRPPPGGGGGHQHLRDIRRVPSS